VNCSAFGLSRWREVRHTEVDDEGCLCEGCNQKCEVYETVVTFQDFLRRMRPEDVTVKLIVVKCPRRTKR
jgi:hypothetical protein